MFERPKKKRDGAITAPQILVTKSKKYFLFPFLLGIDFIKIILLELIDDNFKNGIKLNPAIIYNKDEIDNAF